MTRREVFGKIFRSAAVVAITPTIIAKVGATPATVALEREFMMHAGSAATSGCVSFEQLNEAIKVLTCGYKRLGEGADIAAMQTIKFAESYNKIMEESEDGAYKRETT